ncbi:hypothetical protein AABB24_030567 [Solanum stoloniferum]|uniref:Uncharacterized protein n=1 Tax=Solanum stoloniferum TaxID=62892 RepID=A0ABD2RR57_9SOLN
MLLPSVPAGRSDCCCCWSCKREEEGRGKEREREDGGGAWRSSPETPLLLSPAGAADFAGCCHSSSLLTAGEKTKGEWEEKRRGGRRLPEKMERGGGEGERGRSRERGRRVKMFLFFLGLGIF